MCNLTKEKNMRQLIGLILLFLSTNLIFGQEIAKVENVKIHSKELNQEREIFIYTPKGYEKNTLVSYDIIYVFDSQDREFFDFTHSIISFLSDTSKKYIVVGITSPYIEKSDYARNNDLLPELETDYSKKHFGKYSGNADNFLKYVKNEVVPYIDKNYRTRSKRIAVGHSLSASFILYSMIKEPYLFNDYFAISPNLAYDNERLARELLNFDFPKLRQTFLYISNANEGNYWEQWIPARDKVYSFIENSNKIENIHFIIKKFPNESHWSTFAPSLNYGLKEYFEYLDNQKTMFSKDTYDIEIKVIVPNENDTVYVTGNQVSLGDWNPSQIKMNRESNFERIIKIKVKSPVELKFTRGSWNTEGEVKYNDGYNNINLNPKTKSEFEFEILEWADRIE